VTSNAGRARIESDLGVVYGKEGRLGDSERMLRQSLEHSPLSTAYLNLGITLLRMGDLEGAEAATAEATGRNPLYARAWAMRAVVALRRGHLEQAEEWLAYAQRLGPTDPTVRGATQEITKAARGP
jgi:Flp pilus assembly protein TadD